MVRRKELNFIRLIWLCPSPTKWERAGVRAMRGILQLELLPLADGHAQGGGETFVAQAAFIGHPPDELVVGLIMQGM
jgi:hypothetical protein